MKQLSRFRPTASVLLPYHLLESAVVMMVMVAAFSTLTLLTMATPDAYSHDHTQSNLDQLKGPSPPEPNNPPTNPPAPDTKDADEIVAPLPGLNFRYPAKQYSGYLRLSSRNNIHYWLIESQSVQPEKDPLILWVNGGPGCSSLEGLFTAPGPFFPEPDGSGLFENIYSWNKLGNMLFLDSPRDAGFSYRDPDADPLVGYSDEAVAADNAESVQKFVERFPEYKGRTFYIFGISYAGVYIPSLTQKLIQLIQNNQLDLNLTGIAIGNGLFSLKHDINAVVNMAFYRGITGISDFAFIKDNCCKPAEKDDNEDEDDDAPPLQDCDFSRYISVDASAVLSPKLSEGGNDSVWDACAVKLTTLLTDNVIDLTGTKPNRYNLMNTNGDCYAELTGRNLSSSTSSVTQQQLLQVARSQEARGVLAAGDSIAKDAKGLQVPIADGLDRFVDQGALFNAYSTDPFGGLPCYGVGAAEIYLNSSEVRRAIHIPELLDGREFKMCKQLLGNGYKISYFDTTPLFEWIIDESGYPLNILLYTGDADMLVTFLGVSDFVHQKLQLPLVESQQRQGLKREPWLFQKADFAPVPVGYVERFAKKQVSLDLLTVTSAGHFAQMDTPGPTLQMIANFMSGGVGAGVERNYSQRALFSAFAGSRTPMESVLQPVKAPRKQADRIENLPGLTFPIFFNHYSGYLRSGEADYLHYWLVESQSNPSNDPLVLWLEGGPGCSALLSLLSKNGPFHVNSDGKTLFENPFAWNKVANILYMEGPVGAGYAYHADPANPPVYSDTQVANGILQALLDFFTTYPEYAGRRFYIIGESYAAIYLPQLAKRLLDYSSSSSTPSTSTNGAGGNPPGGPPNPTPIINLAGMVVGSGVVSHKRRINSIVGELYNRGFIGKREWDWLWKECCASTTTYHQMPLQCDFASYTRLVNGTQGNVVAAEKGSECGEKIASWVSYFKFGNVPYDAQDFMQIYQDCYQQQRLLQKRGKKGAKQQLQQLKYDTSDGGNNPNANDYSTDALGGIPCFHHEVSEAWLNQDEVRAALHIPSYVQKFRYCRWKIRDKYDFQYQYEPGEAYDAVIQQLNNRSNDGGDAFQLLFYNGDADFGITHTGNQWFVEDLVARNGLTVTGEHSEWLYRQAIAGYVKRFSSANGNNNKLVIDLLTVKGAGHAAPMDRNGPMMQMFVNYLAQRADYSTPVTVKTGLKPLIREYQVKERTSSSSPSSPSTHLDETDATEDSLFILAQEQSDAVKNDENASRHPIAQPQQRTFPAYIEMRRKERLARKRGHRTSPFPSESSKIPLETQQLAQQQPDLPAPSRGSKEDNRIDSLPGLTFPLGAEQYSGYLLVDSGVFLHYWLITSQSEHPDSDPLVLWLNGGPGCSSLIGMLTTQGPFRPTNDEEPKLVENVWGWTRAANMLYLEAPRGVGFSYSTGRAAVPLDAPYNDTITAQQNVRAILRFFARFPEYKNRNFVVAGESYGGVYVPTLVNELIDTINTQNIDYINLVGVAIGNGILSEYNQINSASQLAYYRGFTDRPTLEAYTKCCPPSTPTPSGYIPPCELTRYMEADPQGYWSARAGTDNDTEWECGLLGEHLGFDLVWMTRNNPYNTLLDCYGSEFDDEGSNAKNENDEGVHEAEKERRMNKRPMMDGGGGAGDGSNSEGVGVLTSGHNRGFIDQAKVINMDGTDQFHGAECTIDDAMIRYLRRKDVLKAIHVDIEGMPSWEYCNDVMNNNYVRQNFDTTPVFKQILSRLASSKRLGALKFLIFNGDLDLVCNFLGDQWFVENLAAEMNMKHLGARDAWYFTQPSANYNFTSRLAGFTQRYRYKSLATFTTATVKGSGHMAAMDRPGPMLQLIYNWLNDLDISARLPATMVEPKSSSSLLNAISLSPPPSKALRDKVFSLPGLTFTPNFGQHSGYVEGAVPGNQLFYWLVEPQRDFATAPVLLWLQGGPGCASTNALLAENGPYRVNPDGRTLFENVHSWNKGAFVIYLDSPRGVGFSYQDREQNPDEEWDDDKTAADVTAAIAALYRTYPHMLKGRDFYLSGESYAGVYVPTVALRLMNQLQPPKRGQWPKKEPFDGLGLNFRGFLVGNGFFSRRWSAATFIDFLYFHAILSKPQWEELHECCNPPGELYCQMEMGRICKRRVKGVLEGVFQRIFPYNIYQQCYELPQLPTSSSSSSTKGDPDQYTSTNRISPYMNALVQKLASDDNSTAVSMEEVWHTLRWEMLFHPKESMPLASPIGGQSISGGSSSPLMGLSPNEDGGYSTSSSDGATGGGAGAFSQQLLLNYASNDQTGYPCYGWWLFPYYLRQSYVREALHVPDFVPAYQECSVSVRRGYHLQYNTWTSDMGSVFRALLSHDYVTTQQSAKGPDSVQPPFRILLYNGDADIVCSFLEAEFFVDELASTANASVSGQRRPWHFSPKGRNPKPLQPVAGFVTSYNFSSGGAQLDLLTVKGAGHFVPLDRSGPALQMVYNFLRRTGNYSSPLEYSLERQPLKKQYQRPPPIVLAPRPSEPDSASPATPTTSIPTDTTTTTEQTPNNDETGAGRTEFLGSGALAHHKIDENKLLLFLALSLGLLALPLLHPTQLLSVY